MTYLQWGGRAASKWVLDRKEISINAPNKKAQERQYA